MSVIMTLSFEADPEALERYASENREQMQSILAGAQEHGLIAHRFCRSADGQRVMVLDEWPDAQSFEAFFQARASEIGPMMEAVGVTAQPEPVIWHELATGDAFGWGA